jgi:hypothetical protein
LNAYSMAIMGLSVHRCLLMESSYFLAIIVATFK